MPVSAGLQRLVQTGSRDANQKDAMSVTRNNGVPPNPNSMPVPDDVMPSSAMLGTPNHVRDAVAHRPLMQAGGQNLASSSLQRLAGISDYHSDYVHDQIAMRQQKQRELQFAFGTPGRYGPKAKVHNQQGMEHFSRALDLIQPVAPDGVKLAQVIRMNDRSATTMGRLSNQPQGSYVHLPHYGPPPEHYPNHMFNMPSVIVPRNNPSATHGGPKWHEASGTKDHGLWLKQHPNRQGLVGPMPQM